MILPCRLIRRQRQCKRESTLMMKGRQRHNDKDRKTREPWSTAAGDDPILQSRRCGTGRPAVPPAGSNRTIWYNLVQAHRQISNVIARRGEHQHSQPN